MKEIQFLLDKNPLLKSRKLILNENFIRLIERDHIHFTEFNKDSIKDFKFGIKMYRGRYTYVGRAYQIIIRNEKNEEIRIIKKSAYRIGVKNHHELYKNIVNALFEFYFNDIARDFYKKYQSGETFTVCNVIFSINGIIIDVDKIIKEKKILIEWRDVGVHYYARHLTIYSKSNAADISRLYHYLDDWNTGVLHILMKWIVKENN